MKPHASLALLVLLVASKAFAVDVLPGTQPLTWDGDISLRMIDDLHAFADRETAASIERRARRWNREFSSPEAYSKSIEPNRARLRKLLGVEFRSVADSPAEIFEIIPPSGERRPLTFGDVKFEAVRWPTFRLSPGYALHAKPAGGELRGIVLVVVDDAFRFGPLRDDFSEFIGAAQRSGYDLYLLSTVDRQCTLSVVAAGARATDQSHREFLFRQAFEMGRHVLGYEVERIHSLLDGLLVDAEEVPVGVFGWGEGGRVALLAGALDKRIDVVGVGGSFGPQERMWEEPIDRNLWGFLDEFGDAELAMMIAPRHLVVAPLPGARYEVPPVPAERRPTAAPGTLRVPTVDDAAAELARARHLAAPLGEVGIDLKERLRLLEQDASAVDPFFAPLGGIVVKKPGDERPTKNENSQDRFATAIWAAANVEMLQRRTVEELLDHTQALVRESEYVRKDWWKNADRTSRDPAKWRESCASYRKHLYDEVLGRFEHVKLPPNARTRKIYDTPQYAGYEVVLDVFGKSAEAVDVWAYGILLVPKDVRPDERRPVVVCQHGLEGRPQELCEPGSDHRAYHGYAYKLAERGFVVFAPQNPYIGKDHFRQLTRKLWPLKKTQWSIIVPQHEQITEWLASLPFVDGERIGFYGLSYGGKTAMRVPALVDRYCLSICSGDFNEWIRKITSIRDPFSYMGTHEYEIMEFDLGHTFNYAELAGLIAPRPFMVERGHRDGVGIDEWVAYEYAKVQLLYADLKIPERTEIEYFDGPHEIHGVGTFDFLHRHLKWPKRE
jgi:cephalosporin-C deacetylase-like acetyl esterase